MKLRFVLGLISQCDNIRLVNCQIELDTQRHIELFIRSDLASLQLIVSSFQFAVVKTDAGEETPRSCG